MYAHSVPLYLFIFLFRSTFTWKCVYILVSHPKKNVYSLREIQKKKKTPIKQHTNCFRIEWNFL